MSALTRHISRFLLIFIFFSWLSFSNAAGQPSGRLIVIRAANFGWNIAANLKIDGRTMANIVQGRRYDHLIPAGVTRRLAQLKSSGHACQPGSTDHSGDPGQC